MPPSLRLRITHSLPVILLCLLLLPLLASGAEQATEETIPSTNAASEPMPDTGSAMRGKRARMHGVQDEGSAVTERIQRLLDQDPCIGLRGSVRSTCLTNARKLTVKVPKRTPAEDRASRRAEALAVKKQGIFAPMLDQYGERIDLRSSDEVLQERRKQVQRLLEKVPPPTPDTRDLIGRRTMNLTKRNRQTTLLCRRRSGIRLISCLEEFGIAINEQTVDEETWEIYLLQQSPGSEEQTQ